eukprot:6214373-Pleurochrysis_carterae.AAC.8
MSAPARVSPLPAVKGLPRLDYLIKLRKLRARQKGEARGSGQCGTRMELEKRCMSGRQVRNQETKAARRMSCADVVLSPPMAETGRRAWYSSRPVRCGSVRASKHRLNGGVNSGIMLKGALLRM